MGSASVKAPRRCLLFLCDCGLSRRDIAQPTAKYPNLTYHFNLILTAGSRDVRRNCAVDEIKLNLPYLAPRFSNLVPICSAAEGVLGHAGDLEISSSGDLKDLNLPLLPSSLRLCAKQPSQWIPPRSAFYPADRGRSNSHVGLEGALLR